MHLTEFHVLLVDDEPDIHEISRLAMRQFRVFGLPIRLHSAHSKEEAIKILESLQLGPGFSLASVALIDVVMETEKAGLELCDYIRNVMKNRNLQIHIRTGQPGLAPERSVLDGYDIQGYLAKAEATTDKLYTIVKAGVREYYFTGLSHGLQDLLHYLIPSAATRSGIADSLRAFEKLARVDRQGEKAETIKAPLCYILENEFVTGLEDWKEAGPALARRDELLALPAEKLHTDGDSYTVDGRDLLIQIAPTAANASLHYMLQGTVAPPDWEVFVYHRYLRSFSALWKQAR